MGMIIKSATKQLQGSKFQAKCPLLFFTKTHRGGASSFLLYVNRLDF